MRINFSVRSEIRWLIPHLQKYWSLIGCLAVYFSLMPVQLINSTVIRELSTIFFSSSLYPGAYIWGVYIRVLISGRLVSWGLISVRLIYPGAYIGGIYPGGIYPGGLLSGGLLSGGLYPGVLYPGGVYPGGLYSTLTIFKDSTCFTLAERARAFAANK